MTFELAAIDVQAFRAQLGDFVPRRRGAQPKLQWIEVIKLRVNRRYQREILKNGRRNILAITREFDWRKFAPLIVAPAKGGLFAIIDGQHRVAAAKLCGIAKVPCQVVDATEAEQADCFAAINGRVTAITPLQLYAAELAAGLKETSTLAKACAEGGVIICRYPIPAPKMKPGETLAIGALKRAFGRYSRDTFVLALRCITATGGGNAGLVRAQLIEAFCRVLAPAPSWRKNEKKLLKIIHEIGVKNLWREGIVVAAEKGMGVTALLHEGLTLQLTKELGEPT